MPLQEETAFIESYVKLQALQVGRNTDLQFQIRGAIEPGHRIAPMILLLFVENCFKHYNRSDRGKKIIHIMININASCMELRTRNTFKENASNEDNFAEKKEGGVGIKSALENLRLLYEEKFFFQTKTEHNIFELILKVPIL